MRDLERALIDIANIRSQMAAGTVFQGFGPSIIAISGLLAIVTTIGQMLVPHLLASSDGMHLGVWIVVAIVSAGLIGVEAVARSKRHHGGLADQMIMNAIEQFLPAGFAGAASGAVLLYFSPDDLWLLPGLWQLFVALGMFAAFRSLPSQMMLVGAWYFLSGLCVLIIAAKSQSLHPLMMGAPFAAGQLLMAYLLYIAEEKPDER